MLSKEIALAAVPAIVLIFQHRAWTRNDRRAHLATLMTVLAVAIFMFWRLAVLGTFGSGITGDQSLFRVLIEGTASWPGLAAGYFTFHARLPTLAGLGLVLATAGLLIALAVTLTRSRRDQPDARQDRFDIWMVILLGLILLLSPALLQAPIARLNAAALSSDITAVEAAMQSRLYFFESGRTVPGVGRHLTVYPSCRDKALGADSQWISIHHAAGIRARLVPSRRRLCPPIA